MSDLLIQNFRTLAQYNTLANRRVYEACDKLSASERKETRPAFFGSIHGALNHIMLGDRIWLTRFAGQEVPSTNLDAILYEDFGELREARAAEDPRIEAFTCGLNEEFLKETIRYTNNEGKIYEDPVVLLVTHLFNHQTHHRGQVHDMLSQTNVPPPVLDLHRVVKPEPDR